MSEQHEDAASRIRRDMDRLEQERRRGPLIDFGGLQLGGKSSAFGVGFGWPEFLGFLAFWYGVAFGRSEDQILTGIVYALAVWLPFRLLISGSLFLYRLFNRNADAIRAPRLPALVAWPIIGLFGGAIIGALLTSALGGDIAPAEGVMKFAPLGLIIGAVIGFFRRKSG